MHAVFLDSKTFDNAIDFSAIEGQVSSFTHYDLTSHTDIVSRAKNADIVITNKVVLTAELLAQLDKCQLICVAATGYNNIDIQAAEANNIAVCNVSGYAKQTVAQYVFAQMLNYVSNITTHNDDVRQGLWQRSETFCLHGKPIFELAGKKLGIVGFGALGKTVATIAGAFDMEVLIAERPEATAIRADRCAFATVVKESDFLSFHCPQTPDTEHMINAELLAQMKPSAVLINTARGKLVDNQALHNALQQGQIAHAILDVLDQEPPPADHTLLQQQLPNLTITGHIAWASIEAQQTLINLIGDNIRAFKQQQMLNRIV